MEEHMRDIITQFLPTIQHFTMLGYWVLFFISLTESLVFVGILVPGTTIIVITGFLSSKGIFDLGDVIWFVAIGAILGDTLSFYLGTREKKLFRPDRKFFHISRLEKAEQFFQKHGGKSVFFGRFIGPMRALIPFIAGMAKMNPRLFVLWNVTSAFAWAVTYLLLGYFFGQAWQVIETWSTRVSLLLIILLLFTIGVYWMKQFIVKNGRQMLALLGSLYSSLKKAVVENSDVQTLVSHHPRFFHFLKSRFQTNSFSGLPLSLLILVFFYTLALFLGVIEDLLMSDPIVAVDVRLENLLYVFRSPELVTSFLWITLLGKAVIIISAALVVSLLFWLHKQRIYIVPLWLVLAGSTVFNVLGKVVFHRPRPELSVYTEYSFSFPSGHATIAVAFYGFIMYILWKHSGTWKRKLNVLFIGLLIILAIGFSRLYLGVHYFSDVWGGYLLGLLWLIIGISLVEWLSAQHSKWQLKPYPPLRHVKILSGLFILGELTFYLVFAAQYSPPLNLPKKTGDERIARNVIGVFSDNHLPKYTETLTGRKQEPLNVLILAYRDDHLRLAFRRAGWYLAEPISVTTTIRIAEAALFNTEYLTAPITPYFWNAQPHDFGFQKPTKAWSVRERHHARFWRTRYLTTDGKRLYVGTASLDSGIKWGLTHKIKPDIDAERDVVLTDLRDAGLVAAFQKVQFVEPMLGYNEFDDPFFTNGMSYVVMLKSM
jgi:membrane protein DedA with SNARE-associated domain